MCELFAVSGEHAARVRVRFAEFATHGAPRDGGNPDGWGAAYYDGLDAHLLREPIPATRSAFVHVLEDHDFHSPLVLAHVRRASQGAVGLVNTQPFAHEMAARRHVFAHNGDMPELRAQWPLGPGCAQPIGQTDSEHAFCLLLRALTPLWTDPQRPPGVQDRFDAVAGFARRLRDFGPANFLYSDGELLFAHAHRRRQSDGVIRPPGLHLLCRGDADSHVHQADGLQVHAHAARAHALAMVASVPLGAGNWRALGEGEIAVLHAGRRIL